MDQLAEQVVVWESRTYEIHVVATAHHIIAQALGGRDILLELRASWPACRDGVLMRHLHGDRNLIAEELARAVQGFLTKGAVTADPGSAPQ